jgi:hypothetical protein
MKKIFLPSLLFSCFFSLFSQKNIASITISKMNMTFPISYSAPMDIHGTTILLTLEDAERFKLEVTSYENINTKNWYKQYINLTGKYKHEGNNWIFYIKNINTQRLISADNDMPKNKKFNQKLIATDTHDGELKLLWNKKEILLQATGISDTYFSKIFYHKEGNSEFYTSLNLMLSGGGVGRMKLGHHFILSYHSLDFEGNRYNWEKAGTWEIDKEGLILLHGIVSVINNNAPLGGGFEHTISFSPWKGQVVRKDKDKNVLVISENNEYILTNEL